MRVPTRSRRDVPSISDTVLRVMDETRMAMGQSLVRSPLLLRICVYSDLYGNPLEENKVARAIDGRQEVKAHGPRDMPVWGERFYIEGQGSKTQVHDRIRKLVAYLQSIQTGRHVALEH